VIGTLVVDEQPYPIIAIVLAKGHFHFWVDLPGSVNLPASSEVRVHAPDGTLVLCAPWHLSPESLRQLRDACATDHVYLCLPLAISEVVGWPPVREEIPL
jgi:hypothetical protein